MALHVFELVIAARNPKKIIKNNKLFGAAGKETVKYVVGTCNSNHRTLPRW